MSLAVVLEQWLLSMNLLPCRYVVLCVTCIGLNVGVRTFAQIFFEIQWLHFLQRTNHAPSLPANVNGISVIRFALFCLETFVFSIFMVLAKLFMLSLGTVTHSTSTQKYEIGF